MGQLEQHNSNHPTLHLLGEKNKALHVLENGCRPQDYLKQYGSRKYNRTPVLIQTSQKHPQVLENKNNAAYAGGHCEK